MGKLEGKRVAVLMADGVEEVEYTKPVDRLEDEGAKTVVVSIHSGKVKAWDMTDWGEKFDVDKTVENVSVDDFDALLLPGGVMNPDLLRMNRDAVQFIRNFYESGKPIAAICHGPWTLVEAAVVRDHTLTSWPSIKTDIMNAGGVWVDEEVVVDSGIVTSRNPSDIPAFNDKMVEEFAEGPHPRNNTAVKELAGAMRSSA